jgi:hypothetical protein
MITVGSARLKARGHAAARVHGPGLVRVRAVTVTARVLFRPAKVWSRSDHHDQVRIGEVAARESPAGRRLCRDTGLWRPGAGGAETFWLRARAGPRHRDAFRSSLARALPQWVWPATASEGHGQAGR